MSMTVGTWHCEGARVMMGVILYLLPIQFLGPIEKG